MPKIPKPPALLPDSTIAIISPASPADPQRVARGFRELEQLGYRTSILTCEPRSYFAGTAEERRQQLLDALRREEFRAVICTRGGYGSNYLLDGLDPCALHQPRILLGYSDITTLQIFLWQNLGWVTFYGPMVAAGFDAGADKPSGYDLESLTLALIEARSGFTLDLRGETLKTGSADGVLVGGCMTLVEATMGTPWELGIEGSILVLEDREMKPYQVDRVLTHFRQAGKFKNVKGIILGEFPESGAPVANGPTVRDVCHRVLGELDIPIVWGVPIGHTPRPMLTIPLGVPARLLASGAGKLEILEPCVTL
ncbi:MAG TPA: LD-carboxypeptidase [Candidatus Dormibacteraeota bacterium]|nr:LD-carboxypeptidase [Candidatus Dormibacteraeota bacterium]